MYEACNENGPLVFTILNKTDINSPNYPDSYPNKMSCIWKFLAVDGFRIQLQIEEGGEIEAEYDLLIFYVIY